MYSGRHSLKDQADFTWHVVEQAADHADDDLAKLLDELVLGHALGDVAHVQPAVLQLDVHLQEGGREQGAKDALRLGERQKEAEVVISCG